jgi:hypothetical protein
MRFLVNEDVPQEIVCCLPDGGHDIIKNQASRRLVLVLYSMANQNNIGTTSG